MTPQEIRELDAWIAENVFNLGATVGLVKRGYFYRPNAQGYTALASEAGRFTLEEAKKHEWVKGEEDDVTIVRWDAPRYSSDPAAAMEVLKRCLAVLEGYQVQIGGTYEHYEVSSGNQLTESVVAGTIELAICRFSKVNAKLFLK